MDTYFWIVQSDLDHRSPLHCSSIGEKHMPSIDRLMFTAHVMTTGYTRIIQSSSQSAWQRISIFLTRNVIMVQSSRDYTEWAKHRSAKPDKVEHYLPAMDRTSVADSKIAGSNLVFWYFSILVNTFAVWLLQSYEDENESSFLLLTLFSVAKI